MTLRELSEQIWQFTHSVTSVDGIDTNIESIDFGLDGVKVKLKDDDNVQMIQCGKSVQTVNFNNPGLISFNGNLK